MTYIHKTVPATSILWKITRAFPDDTDWIPDAIEHIGWGIQAIGYHTGFITKSNTEKDRLYVKDHRALIPCEAERILFIEYFDDDLYNTNNLLDPYGKKIELEEEEYCNRKTIKLPLGSDKSLAAIDKGAPRTTYITPSAHYYDINGKYIVTSFEQGEIKVHWKAFNTDKNGVPLIIDDFNYKECLYWYVVSQLLIAGYRNPVLNYATANAQYEKYLPKAKNTGKMPSIDGMQRFARTWSSYTTNLEWADDYFMNEEQGQQIDF